MTARVKIALAILVALGISFSLGWVLGASGRMEAERRAAAVEQQSDLSEARSAILEARVSLYNVNFGDASQAFEQAKLPLERARQRFLDLGQAERAGHVGSALTQVQEAQRLAGQLDQAANTRAAEALKAIEQAAPR
jgi:hypothetical protein